jgi:SH3 domain-containing protein
VRRQLARIALCCAFAAVLASCGRSGSAEKVSLPPTPVLSIRSTWAVVKSPLLRVRDQPSSQGTLLSHIRLGAVMEILSRSDKEDTIENETAYWFRIDYQGLKGWVFGAYVEVFETRDKADAYAAGLK